MKFQDPTLPENIRTREMTHIIRDLKWKGQPVFQEWSADRKSMRWFSRKITKFPDGSWTIKENVALKEIKLDRRRSLDFIGAQVAEARNSLLDIPGVKSSTKNVLRGTKESQWSVRSADWYEI